MGEILALGLLRAGWEPEDLALAARRPERARETEFHTGITTSLDAAEAAAGKRVVVVAVKPKDVPALLGQIRDTITPDQVVVSFTTSRYC